MSKVTSLYSVVELLKQRAGRNLCSSVCAACVYERVFVGFFFFLIIFNYKDAQRCYDTTTNLRCLHSSV